MNKFKNIKVGDSVTRMIDGQVFMKLNVTKIDDKLIYCGDWTFDLNTGVEEDPELGWGVSFGVTGSYLE